MKFEKLMQEHFDDGREEGISQGRTEKALEIAAVMRSKGVPEKLSLNTPV